MEKKGANVGRKSEKRKPTRARREKIRNYRKWPRRPCCKSIIRKRVSPKTRHRVPKVRTQQPTTTHQHKCRIMDQCFRQLPSTKNVHFAERNPVCDMPSRETIVRSVRIPTTMTERYQAVNSTAARTPCRGSAGRDESPRHNRTHAPTGPRKARTYIGR